MMIQKLSKRGELNEQRKNTEDRVYRLCWCAHAPPTTRAAVAHRKAMPRRDQVVVLRQIRENTIRNTAQATKSAVSAKTFVPKIINDKISFKNSAVIPMVMLPKMQSTSKGISPNSNFR